MNKSKVLTILLGVCLVALGAASLFLFGGSFIKSYADAHMYQTGDTTLEGKVENLEIDWTDGRVTVAYHAGDTVTIAETSRKPISEDLRVRWWLDGTTLRIRYARSGARMLFQNLDKELTVTLPEGTRLKTVSVNGTSADLELPGLSAEEARLETTSGNIRTEAAVRKLTMASTSGDVEGTVDGAEEISAASTSGSISLTQTGEAKAVSLKTTSGGIGAVLENAGSVTAESTSGNIGLEAKKAEKVKAAATSGDVRLTLGAFSELEAGSTSGSVTAALPDRPGFSGEVKTTSGSVESALAMRKEGNTYSCGDGSARVNIHTTSGNVTLK